MRSIYPILFTLCLLFSGEIMAQQAPLLTVVHSEIRGINIYGKPVDQQTRCQHWHSDLDIIAIKIHCCAKNYPCFSCHEETADHSPSVSHTDVNNNTIFPCGFVSKLMSTAYY